MTLNRRIHHVFRPLVAALALALAVVLVMQTSGYSVTSARVQAVERVAGTSTKHPASLKQVLAAVKAAGMLKRLPASVTPRVLESLANDANSAWALPDCQPGYTTTSLSRAGLAGCTFGAAKYRHTLMVIGDSHAAMWEPAFNLIGKRIGWRVIDITDDNCGPAALHYYLYPESREFSQCDKWQTWRMSEINKIDPSIVVLTGWIGGNTGPSVQLTPTLWEQGIESTIHQMRPGIRSVVLADMPHVLTEGPECLAKNSSNIQACSGSAATIVPTAFNQAEAAAAAATGQYYVDPTPWFCDQVCPDVINGIDVYTGLYHINHAFAAYLSGVMQSALEPALSAAAAPA